MMDNPILKTLQSIEGSGAFAQFDTVKFNMPGLKVKGMGNIGLPLDLDTAKQMIALAHKASFGKGSKTVFDPSVRSVWEVDAEKLSFGNPEWEKTLAKIVKRVRKSFGIEQGKVEASLYKLLLYQEGDFFLPHRDSEKEEGMFGTLVVGLPASHKGGELIVRHSGMEHTYDFSADKYLYKIPYAAFYADCEHEVKPLTAGYRLCLVYNLLLKNTEKTYKAPEFSEQISKLAKYLKAKKTDWENLPAAVLLDHQYTPSNFSFHSLKRHDGPRAEAFMKACEIAGYQVRLGLVTYHLSGELEEPDSYYRRRRRYNSWDNDDNLAEDGEMGEIYENALYIEHWVKHQMPNLGQITLDESQVLSKQTLGEDEPIEKDAEGYTGNAGMTMDYWYHYGALIFWPDGWEKEVLNSSNLEVIANWLNYYSNFLTQDQSYANTCRNLIDLMAQKVANRQKSDFWYHYSPTPIPNDCNGIARTLIQLNDNVTMASILPDLLFKTFTKIDVGHWKQLIDGFDSSLFFSFFKQIRQEGEIQKLTHYLNLLHRLSTQSQYQSLVLQELAVLSEGLKNLKDRTDHQPVAIILYQVMELSKWKEEADWAEDLLETFCLRASRDFANNVIYSAILKYKGEKNKPSTLFTTRLEEWCVADLQARTAIKPQPPTDWSRELPPPKDRNKELELIASFVRSPTGYEFKYPAREALRRNMEYAIHSAGLDLTCETIRKGSPHTLRITKNQNSYERKLKEWEEDVKLLKGLT
ncbi:MAG: 2OG-Fe(II) oxygenase [Saprospiraceae bacterium]